MKRTLLFMVCCLLAVFAAKAEVTTIGKNKSIPVYVPKGKVGTYTGWGSFTNKQEIEQNTGTTDKVTNNSDSGEGSLRYVIQNATSGSTIVFEEGVGTIFLISGQITIDKDLIILGTGQIIDGGWDPANPDEYGTSQRLFSIKNGVKVHMESLTLQHGAQKSGSGGAIENKGNLSLDNMIIRENRAENNGGAITVWRDKGYGEEEPHSLSITNSVIDGNQAEGAGGGIKMDNGPEVFLANVLISNNESGIWSAYNGYGSAIHISPGGNLTLINCTVTGNSSNNERAYAAIEGYGNEGDGNDIKVTLYNNVLYNNPINGSNMDLCIYSVNTLTTKNNLIGKNYQNTNNLDVSDLHAIDPLFTNNSNYSLQKGSPAMDAGDDNLYNDVVVPNWNNGSKILNLSTDLDLAGNNRMEGTAIDMGTYERKIDSETPSTYHTITLEVAPGIDIYGLTAGNHQVTEDSHLHLQFLPEDPQATAEDILFLVDGVETSFEDFGAGHYFSYILNPISQDHSILIAMKEYTVTLPELEGVTIDVGAGSHSVAYGEKFAFTLTLDDGIDPANVTVKANGKTIEPEALRNTTLSYVIDRVIGPVMIEITGAGDPTGNINIADSDIQISIVNRQLSIVNSTATAVDVAVYSIAGKNVVSLRALHGSKTIDLQPGIYIVRAGIQTTKVIVH